MENLKQQVLENAVVDTMEIDLAKADISDLKLKVNNLIWCYCNSTVTLGEAEALSTAVFDLILNPREYLKTK